MSNLFNIKFKIISTNNNIKLIKNYLFDLLYLQIKQDEKYNKSVEKLINNYNEIKDDINNVYGFFINEIQDYYIILNINGKEEICSYWYNNIYKLIRYDNNLDDIIYRLDNIQILIDTFYKDTMGEWSFEYYHKSNGHILEFEFNPENKDDKKLEEDFNDSLIFKELFNNDIIIDNNDHIYYCENIEKNYNDYKKYLEELKNESLLFKSLFHECQNKCFKDITCDRVYKLLTKSEYEYIYKYEYDNIDNIVFYNKKPHYPINI